MFLSTSGALFAVPPEPIENPHSDSGAAAKRNNEPRPADGAVEREVEDEQRYRLLPIPILITEPAIGEGLGVALALFHPVKQGKREDTLLGTPDSIAEIPAARDAPPVVTAIAAGYTTNDTWFAALAHANNWREDSIRYAGALGAARVNSTIYLQNRPLAFSMEAAMVYQDLKIRLGRSDWMLGGALAYLDADNRFGTGLPGPVGDDRFALHFSNVGLSAKLLYESRDSAMHPTSGQLLELSLWRYDEAIGGSFEYWSWEARALSFHPLSGKSTLGLRLDISGVDGRPPFFGYPWVSLRGIPALRYQNRVAGALELEWRYLLAPRWEASVFGGLGHTSDDVPLFDNPGSIYNFGLGVRYNVFQAHNVWLGLDIARGPEEWNWYIQVGHPW
jgi:hypothetical protein